MTRTLLLVFILFLTMEITLGQEYPFLRKVQIEVKVTHDPLISMFYYDYSLTNDAKNLGEIDLFRILIWRDSSATIAYDTSGLQFAGSTFWESYFRRSYAGIGGWVVPVGFLPLPKHWEGAAISGNRPFAKVMNFRDPIAPGHRVTGLVMMSRALPGRRECVVEPNFDIDKYFQDLDDPRRVLSLHQEDSIREAVKYHGYTVGPWAPPAKFDPLVVLDTLASFVYESRVEGWIRSNAGYEKYILLLASAKVGLLGKDMRTAIRYLREVLLEAKADESHVLKPEAYALIRYNTEYLLKQLGMGKSRKE
jgi:hypothetical protein